MLAEHAVNLTAGENGPALPPSTLPVLTISPQIRSEHADAAIHRQLPEIAGPALAPIGNSRFVLASEPARRLLVQHHRDTEDTARARAALAEALDRLPGVSLVIFEETEAVLMTIGTERYRLMTLRKGMRLVFPGTLSEQAEVPHINCC